MTQQNTSSAVTNNTCATCRWFAECAREHGAHPDDSRCAGYVPDIHTPQPQEPRE